MRSAGGPAGRSERLSAALGWSFVLNGGQMAATAILSFVLAAILGPEAFGTIAMANVFVLFVQIILRQGMIPALVQRENLTPVHSDTAFWLMLAGGAGLGAVVAGSSGLWADLNRLPELGPVLVGLAPVLPIRASVLVQDALLRRDLDFRLLAVRTNAAVLSGGALGVVLAVMGAGVWALVGQQLMAAVVEAAVLWRVTEWRPSLRFSAAAYRDLLGFSSRSALASIGVFASQRSDALLLGLFFGAVPVGLYRMAARLLSMIVQMIVSPIQSVSLPGLAEVQTDGAAVVERYVAMLRLAAALSFPPLACLVIARDSVLGLLGADWLAAADVLAILSIATATEIVALFVGPALQAMGRPGRLAQLSWISGAAGTAALVVVGVVFSDASLEQQLTATAVVRTALMVLVVTPITLRYLYRFVGVSWRDVWTALRSPLAVTIVVSLSALAMSAGLRPASSSPVVRLLGIGVVAGLIQLALLYRLEPGVYRQTGRLLTTLGIRRQDPVDHRIHCADGGMGGAVVESVVLPDPARAGGEGGGP